MQRQPIAALALLYGLLGWSFVACQSNPKRPQPSDEQVRAHLEASTPQDSVEIDLDGPLPVDSQPQNLPRPNANHTVVATAAGQSIHAADLVGAWMFRDSQGVRELLDRLVLDRLATAEAARLGVRLDGAMVSKDWKSTLAEFEAEVQRADPDRTRDQFIRERLGMDPDVYLHSMANRRRLDLLAARCVRAFSLESENIEARLLVAPDRQTADRVEAGLAQGRSFEALAREHSIDPSAEEGGRIPPVVRSRASIARLVFATPLGEVGGPLQERGRFLYVLPERHHPGQSGPWSQLGPKVEASLAERPIEDLEFVQWQAMALERYEVDTRPLLRFLGHERAD